MQKAYPLIGGIAVIIVAFYAFNAYLYHEKQGSGDTESYRATLTGMYLCVQPRDMAGAEDAVCATGLRTEAGEQYLVDFNLMSGPPVPIAIGDTFTASGVVTPMEMLSTDKWRAYDLQGIFSVTDSFSKK